MILELEKLLWVIPGVIFIYQYNKRRNSEVINLSGWSYIFALVTVASITWLPIDILFSYVIEHFSISISSKMKVFLLAVFSSFFSFGLVLISTYYVLFFSKWILPKVYDDFILSCLKLKVKPVILSLKNGKVYTGILCKYPSNPKSRYESQIISIIPIKSGFRSKDTGEVQWGIKYPTEEEFLTENGIIIPRSEIVTFGKFNKKIFEYFNNSRNLQKNL